MYRTDSNTLLDQIEKDDRFVDPGDPITPRQQLAYCLATFNWETAHTRQPIDEYGGDAYFNTRYGPGTAPGKALGNTQPGESMRCRRAGGPPGMTPSRQTLIVPALLCVGMVLATPAQSRINITALIALAEDPHRLSITPAPPFQRS